MPNLSIKNVPDDVVQKLRTRAAANHRSLQGELMALVCAAAEDGPRGDAPEVHETGWKSVEQILMEQKTARRRPVSKAPRAVDIIRSERDNR